MSLGGINYAEAVYKDLQILAKWVCHRKTLEQLINMITQGQLKIRAESGTITKSFTLDEVEEAKEEVRWLETLRSHEPLEERVLFSHERHPATKPLNDLRQLTLCGSSLQSFLQL